MDTVEHVSLQQLERHAAGLLSDPEVNHVVTHLGTCERCRDSYDSVQRSRSEFLARNPPLLRAEELIERRTRSARSRWLGLAGALATAAALVVVTLQLGTEPDVIEKGDALVVFRIEPAGSTKAWIATDEVVLSPGDRIQIEIRKRSHVAVFGMDHAGELGELMRAEIEGPLPQSLIQDDSREPEAIFVAVSATPIDGAEVKAHLGAAFREAGSDITRMRPEDPTLIPLLIRKAKEKAPTDPSPDVSPSP